MSQLPLLPPAPVTSIKIIVPGEPVPKGRHRSRIVQPRNRPAFIHTYPDPETVKYETAIAWCAKGVMGPRGLLLGPLEARITVWVPIPKSWSIKQQVRAMSGEIRPTSRPDGDNYQKAAMDAMNGIVYKDDAQIVDGSFSKRYSDSPRLEIEILAA